MTTLERIEQNRNSTAYSVRLRQIGRLLGELLLLFAVVGNVAHLLFEHANRLKVGSVIEGITAKEKKLRNMLPKMKVIAWLTL